MGSDTVLAISYKQLVLVNEGLNGYMFSLKRDSLYKEQIKLKDLTINLKDSIIGEYSKKCTLINNEYNLEKKYSNSLQEQIKINKRKYIRTSFGVGVVGVLAGFLAGVIFK